MLLTLRCSPRASSPSPSPTRMASRGGRGIALLRVQSSEFILVKNDKLTRKALTEPLPPCCSGAALPAWPQRGAVPAVGRGAALRPRPPLSRGPGHDDHGAVERGAHSHRHVDAARGAHHPSLAAARPQRELRHTVRRAAQRHLRCAVVVRLDRECGGLQAYPGARPLVITPTHAHVHSAQCTCTCICTCACACASACEEK